MRPEQIKLECFYSNNKDEVFVKTGKNLINALDKINIPYGTYMYHKRKFMVKHGESRVITIPARFQDGKMQDAINIKEV